MNPTCKSCKHWEKARSYEDILGLGRCKAVSLFWDATKWSEENGREMRPEYASIKAFVHDGSYMAKLITSQDFVCAMYEGDFALSGAKRLI